jgi:DNA-binding response OmpR family regulator
VWFLIVDDNEVFRDGLTRKLTDKGHKVETASLALEVVSRLSVIPDVLILDYHLTAINGVTLLQELRKHKGWDKLPVILATADKNATIPDDTGPSMILVKPFDEDELLIAVDNLIQSTRS